MNEKNKPIYHISQCIVCLKDPLPFRFLSQHHLLPSCKYTEQSNTRNLCTGPEGRGPTLNQCITGIKLHRKNFFNTKGSERAVTRERSVLFFFFLTCEWSFILNYYYYYDILKYMMWSNILLCLFLFYSM